MRILVVAMLEKNKKEQKIKKGVYDIFKLLKYIIQKNMLAYIKGNLAMKQAGYVVIDVGGLGYKVFMSEIAIDNIGKIGEIVKVYTYYRVKEDDISIFGFNTNEELKMFELLIQVSGIGAKTALVMLNSIEPSVFALAVISNDIDTLKKIPGIGAKSAQRIVLELKDKLKKEQAITEISDATVKTKISTAIKADNKVEEALSALQVLGYNRKEIEKALEQIDKESLSLEQIIKELLKIMSFS